MEKKFNVKILIIVLVVLVGVVGAVIFFLNRGKNEDTEDKKPKASTSVGENFSVSLEDMYSNLRDSKKILKVKMTVQTDIEENQAVIESRQFVIRDEANKIIRNTTEEELSGTGYENVRRAIEKTIQRYFEDETIVVYFDDFVFQ